MKVIVWNSKGKRAADYHELMRGCDALCLLDCGDWTIHPQARQIQPHLYYWHEENEGKQYDVFYSTEGLSLVLRGGWYDGEAVVYQVHSTIKPLIGVRLKDNFWLFGSYDSNLAKAHYISEFYLREISDRFNRAAFVSTFTEQFSCWTKESLGNMFCVLPPEGYSSNTLNYLFTIHVACTDMFLVKGYEDSNQPTLYNIEI